MIAHIGSCFATRSDALSAAVQKHEKQLYDIRLIEETKARGIKQIIGDFEQAKAALKNDLKKNEYTGRDQLGITAVIIQRLKVKT